MQRRGSDIGGRKPRGRSEEDRCCLAMNGQTPGAYIMKNNEDEGSLAMGVSKKLDHDSRKSRYLAELSPSEVCNGDG